MPSLLIALNKVELIGLSDGEECLPCSATQVHNRKTMYRPEIAAVYRTMIDQFSLAALFYANGNYSGAWI